MLVVETSIVNSVVILNTVMLNVVVLSVVAPSLLIIGNWHNRRIVRTKSYASIKYHGQT
jgi:hypothetical protein